MSLAHDARPRRGAAALRWRLLSILARGPFDAADERELLRQHSIDIVIAKNSGGDSTYGKIAAARELGLPVLLLRRPVLPATRTVTAMADAMAWVEAL